MKDFSLRSVVATSLCCGALLLSSCGGGGGGSDSSSGGGNTGQPPLSPPPAAKVGITLLAGDIGGPGYVDGVGALARFTGSNRVAVDSAGTMYVAESGTRRIRKVTRAGVVTTLAGSGIRFGGDGSAMQASFCEPLDIAVDPDGNVFVVDYLKVRKITPDGNVTTVAGFALPLNCALFGSGDIVREYGPQISPVAIAIDALGVVYIATNGAVRTLTPNGVLTMLALYSKADPSTYGLAEIKGIAVDAARNVYVTSESSTVSLTRITPSGQVTPLAKPSASILDPGAIAADASGNLFILDSTRPIVRKATPSGSISLYAGVEGQYASIDGPPGTARLDSPQGIAIDRDGTLIVAERTSIRRIDQAGNISTIAGAATPSEPNFAPYHATDRAGNVYVAQQLLNSARNPEYALRRIAPDGATTTVLAGGLRHPQGMVVDRAGNVYVLDLAASLNPCFNCTASERGVLYKITPEGKRTVLAGSLDSSLPFVQTDGSGAAATLDAPLALAIDSADNLYIGQNNASVRKVTPSGVVSTLPTQRFGNLPSLTGMVVDGDDNLLVSSCDQTAGARFSLTFTGSVIKIGLRGGSALLAGSATESGYRDGPGPQALFNGGQVIACLRGIALDAAGNAYVADTGNDVIRKITPNGTVSTVVGQQGKGSIVLGDLPGSLSSPTDVSFDAAGNLYVGMAHAIVKVRLAPE